MPKRTVRKKKATTKASASRKPRRKRPSKARLEKFRRILEARRDELTKQYRTEVERSRGQAGDGIEDYVDYAVSSYTKEFLLSLSDMERQQLQLVEDALRRIEEATYGICEECEQEISEKRLEAVSWARHCIRCQNLEEQGILARLALREAAPKPAGEEGAAEDDSEGEEREGRRGEEED